MLGISSIPQNYLNKIQLTFSDEVIVNFLIFFSERGTFICAHAWIFFKLCMIITIYIQVMKMYLFNSITKTRTQEATLTYSHYEVIPVSKV